MIGDRYKDVYYSNNDTVYKPIPPLLAAGNTKKKNQHFLRVTSPALRSSYSWSTPYWSFYH